MNAPRRLTLTVTPDQAGRKVDDLLRGTLGLSGTAVKRAKRLEDGLLLDGVRVTVGDRVEAGQVLSVAVGDTEGSGAIVPAPGPLDIVYQDRDVLVLNKAPGVAVHPGPGHYSDTIGNFLIPGQTVRTADHLLIQDQAASHTGSQGDHQKVFIALAAALPHLA